MKHSVKEKRKGSEYRRATVRDDAVDFISESPGVGDKKRGDLVHLWVYKFGSQGHRWSFDIETCTVCDCSMELIAYQCFHWYWLDLGCFQDSKS